MPDNVLTENEYRTLRRIAAQETGSSQSVLSFDARLVQLIDGHFNGRKTAWPFSRNSPASAGPSSKVSCSEGAAVRKQTVAYRGVRRTVAEILTRSSRSSFDRRSGAQGQ